MAAGGTNGTVKGVTSGPSGRAATVHFDDPPPAGRNEEYTNLSADNYLTLCTGANDGWKVDVTVDASGSATTAAAHKP